MIGRAVRRRPRGGPYRDRFAASAPGLWATLSDCAQASVEARRAGPLRSHPAVPAPALVLASFARTPWIWLAVLAISTVVAGSALAVSSTPIHAPAVAASLATLAGWFVWIRLWQLRRRVAAWNVTG